MLTDRQTLKRKVSNKFSNRGLCQLRGALFGFVVLSVYLCFQACY